MKIIIAFCALCTIASKVETQSFYNLQQRKPFNVSSAQNNENNERSITFLKNSKITQSYDEYIQEMLDKRNAEALANRKTENNRINNEQNEIYNDDINLINRGQSIRPLESEESPITSSPVRFVGVGKTDVEQLNNVTYAVTNFGVQLMKSVNHLQNGNIIVSPTSLATVLALLQQGTRGEAQEEITKTLQMTPDVTAPTYRRLTYDMKKRNSRNILTVSNNLYIGDGFEINPDFKETAIQNFGSEVTVMDFSRPALAVKQINKWVAIQTHNKIENLLQDNAVKHNTQLVIANAVYFKGLWETKFKKEATKTLIFRLSSGEAKSVPFMRMRHSFKYGIDEQTRSFVTILPFERHQYSLILILPHQLSNVDSTLNSLTNSKLVSYHNFEEYEIQLEIPKFTIKSDTDMIQVLKKMGIKKIFSSQTDLTGIGTYRTYSPELSQAIHTGYLSVDEQGLSAAGASSFAAVALSYDEPAAIFQANRPFIAVLWDTQFAIPLFIAKIEDPSQ